MGGQVKGRSGGCGREMVVVGKIRVVVDVVGVRWRWSISDLIHGRK